MMTIDKYFKITAETTNGDIDKALECLFKTMQDIGLVCCGLCLGGKLEYSAMEDDEFPVLPLEEGKEQILEYMQNCGDFVNIHFSEIIEEPRYVNEQREHREG
jgi:hypothetical protein